MKARNFITIIIKGFVHLYQWTIRPFIGSSCRFYPTCSDYALEALKKHGPWKGVCLTCKRLSRCHPWNEGGVDLP